MPDDANLPRFIAPANGLAFVAVAVAGIMGAATAPPKLVEPRLVPFVIGGGALYALGGPIGLYWLERHGTAKLVKGFLLALLAVGAAIDVVTHGAAALLMLGVVSAGVLYLSTAYAALFTLVAFTSTLVPLAASASGAGELATAFLSYTAALGFVIVFTRMARVQHRQRAEVERLAGELGAANERLRAYAAEVEHLATEAERSRIAREIHDGLGHSLTVVHVQIEAAEALLEKDPARARAALQKAQRGAHEGLNDVRRSVAVLRGASPTGPLSASLERLGRACSREGVEVKVVVRGEPRPLAAPVESALYRAAQEALTNVCRHAQAAHVEVELTFAERVRLSVKDDGVGADAPAGGFGLVGLRERAEQLGGSVAIVSEVGRGFALELEVPA